MSSLDLLILTINYNILYFFFERPLNQKSFSLELYFISVLFIATLHHWAPKAQEVMHLKEKSVNTQHSTYYLLLPRKWEIKL